MEMRTRPTITITKVQSQPKYRRAFSPKITTRIMKQANRTTLNKQAHPKSIKRPIEIQANQPSLASISTTKYLTRAEKPQSHQIHTLPLKRYVSYPNRQT
eukprot:c18260_g1_i1 orf=47-346(+)